MRIDYSPRSREVCLTATKAEFSELTKKYLLSKSIIPCPETELKIKPPYENFLNGVIIQQTKDKLTTIQIVENNFLEISGAVSSLEIFSDNLKTLSENPDWVHLHIEYYPEHPYLSEESLPIVLVVQE